MTLRRLMKLLELPPPSLRHLVRKIERSEVVVEFRQLVEEFLLEEAADIMSEPEEYTQVERFISLFSAKYFELAEYVNDEDEAVEELMRGIPVPLEGMGYEQYHDIPDYFDNDPGFMAAVVLVSYPFANTDEEAGGAKIPLLEKLAAWAQGLEQRIPALGYSPKQLHEWLDGTKYKALPMVADWLHGETDSHILNVPSEEFQGDYPDWTREWVDILTEEEKYRRDYNEQTYAFFKWLDDVSHLRELLDFIARKEDEWITKQAEKKGQMTLFQISSEESYPESSNSIPTL